MELGQSPGTLPLPRKPLWSPSLWLETTEVGAAVMGRNVTDSVPSAPRGQRCKPPLLPAGGGARGRGPAKGALNLHPHPGSGAELLTSILAGLLCRQLRPQSHPGEAKFLLLVPPPTPLPVSGLPTLPSPDPQEKVRPELGVWCSSCQAGDKGERRALSLACSSSALILPNCFKVVLIELIENRVWG